MVALDVETIKQAKVWVKQLSPYVDIFKVGSQLFTAAGPQAIQYISGSGKKVFLDLKYHDIPHTVAGAVKAAVGLCMDSSRKTSRIPRDPKETGVVMLTVHAAGGEKMLKAAVDSSRETAGQKGILRPLIIAVTVLTSEVKQDSMISLVLERAQLARRSGCDGVVASCQEAGFIRQEFGEDFIIITPGIRPLGNPAGDQERIATPRQAVQNGSHYLVAGRPILEAEDPVQAVKDILKEMKT